MPRSRSYPSPPGLPQSPGLGSAVMTKAGRRSPRLCLRAGPTRFPACSHRLRRATLSTRASRSWTRFLGRTCTSFTMTPNNWLRIPRGTDGPQRVFSGSPDFGNKSTPLPSFETGMGRSEPRVASAERDLPPRGPPSPCFCRHHRQAPADPAPSCTPHPQTSAWRPGGGGHASRHTSSAAHKPNGGPPRLPGDRPRERKSTPCASPGAGGGVATSRARTRRRQLDGHVCREDPAPSVLLPCSPPTF